MGTNGSQAITGVGTQVLLGPPAGQDGDYLLIGEGANLTSMGREFDTNDVTSFTSPTRAKEKNKGLLNPGQFLLIGNRIFDDASQAALNVAFLDPRPYMFQVIFPVNPDTGGGEIWTFAALVLSIDPPKIAPNKALQFFCKMQVTGPRITSTGYLNAAGMATKNSSRPLGSYTFGMIWSDFSLSPLKPLPSRAQILGIYPVIICSAVFDICFQDLVYGPSVGLEGLGEGLDGTGFNVPFSISLGAGTTFASTEFTDVSIGTSLSALTGQMIGASIDSSLFSDSINDSLTVIGVGFAIYYQGGVTRIDSQMPPPFAVPPGQGLAWALPFGATTVMDSPGSPRGTAVATPATLNGVAD